MPSATRPASRIAFVAFAAICANNSFADRAPPPRFRLDGNGSLSPGAPVLRGETLQLKATLVPLPASGSGPLLQANGRFVVSGTFSAASLVCYNDTIYRDDFDGDGF